MNEAALYRIEEDVRQNFDVSLVFPEDAIIAFAWNAFKRNQALEQDNTELSSLAFEDELTGIPNRRGMSTHLSEFIAHAPENAVAVIGVLDIDRFKIVNDVWGHNIGDATLCVLADALKGVVRGREGSKDLAARIGGDEFMLFMDLEDTVLTDEEIDSLAGGLASRINNKLSITLPNGSTIQVSASIGIARLTVKELREKQANIDVIKKLADQKMYVWKSSRPDRDPVLIVPEP